MKDKDSGRSPDGDGLSQAEPVSAVSALRASIPSAIEALFEEQSVKQCRVLVPGSPGSKPLPCTTHQKYHGHRPHEFQGAITCESCKHMGGVSWPDPFGDKHWCRREKERRATNFRSSGDFAQDFMSEFRKFYDASPRQWAENCRFFEPRDLPASGIAARSDETPQAAQPEGQEPGPQGDAHPSPPSPPTGDDNV